ncbi:MAG: N-acyl-D-amino-acid deacylase [Nocardiaceae bacterium]|nr:N-acyl-D-amino-acid deacylase [Nocardiaceae bacterium]
MADVVSIDVVRVRAAARALQADADVLGEAAGAVAGCEFGRIAGTADTAPERAIREGYLRLARAIGAWATASDVAGRALAATADAYAGQDTATADNIVFLGGR